MEFPHRPELIISLLLVLTVHDVNLQCHNEVGTGTSAERPEQLPLDTDALKIVEKKFLEFMGLKKKPDHRKLKGKLRVPNEMWKLYCDWSSGKSTHPLRRKVDTVRMVHQQQDEGMEYLGFMF